MSLLSNEEIVGKDPNLQVESYIGRGGGGRVYRVLSREAGKSFARKLLRPDRIYVDAESPAMPQEALVVDSLFLTDEGQVQENLTQVFRHGWLPDINHYFIDMELCDFDLENYIKGADNYLISDEQRSLTRLQGKRGPYDIVQIAKQIANGVAFIHLHNKVHRDLKPKNILYSRSKNNWKIADFGLATEGDSGRSVCTEYGRGTEGYYAPEFVLAGSGPIMYTNSVDIWALGCIIYELATGKMAFENNRETLAFGISGKPFPRSRFPFHGPAAEFIFLLIEKMLKIDKKARPNADDVRADLYNYTFNSSVQSTKYAYNLDDKSWLTMVGDKVHHVRTLCNRSFGNQVYEIRELSSGTSFARKLIRPFGSALNEKTIKSQRALFMKKLSLQNEKKESSRYIVEIFEVNVLHCNRPVNATYYYIDMELCETDLSAFIKTPSFKGESNIWKIMGQIASGVYFVHQRGLVIRDLKPSRVLYSKSQIDGIWKLGDFSLVAAEGPQGTQEYVDDPNQIGTEGYRSPEQLDLSHFNTKTDIWGMGCILNELVTGQQLFANDYAIVGPSGYMEKAATSIETADVIQPLHIQLSTCLREVKSLAWKERNDIKMTLLHMLAVLPEERPSADDLEEPLRRLIDTGAPSIRTEHGLVRQG